MKSMSFLDYLTLIACEPSTWDKPDTYGAVHLTDLDYSPAGVVTQFKASHTLGSIFIEAVGTDEKIRIYKWGHTACVLEVYVGEEENAKVFHLPIGAGAALITNTIRTIIKGDV